MSGLRADRSRPAHYSIADEQLLYVGSQEASDGGIDRINDALVVIVEGGVEDDEYSS
jgi:hypothetical protein